MLLLLHLVVLLQVEAAASAHLLLELALLLNPARLRLLGFLRPAHDLLRSLLRLLALLNEFLLLKTLLSGFLFLSCLFLPESLLIEPSSFRLLLLSQSLKPQSFLLSKAVKAPVLVGFND